MIDDKIEKIVSEVLVTAPVHERKAWYKQKSVWGTIIITIITIAGIALEISMEYIIALQAPFGAWILKEGVNDLKTR